MKRHTLTPRPCPCGGWIVPYEDDKRCKFEARKYCSNTCPKAHEWKRGGKYKAICKAAEVRKARTPETNTDSVDLYLMGRWGRL